ncbi:MAG: S1/P1 nuclease [Chitinophagaceae bacterium]
MQKKILNRLSKSFAFLLLILLPSVCFSWGVTGHRVVAEIAQRHLSKKAQKEIYDLIGRHSLASLANWPDFMKSDTTGKWKAASKWHYVDLPGNLNKEDFVDALQKLDGKNLYTQIPAMENQLKDKSLPVEERVTALKFLIHLVGDLHQPLHVGREEDYGGNKIKVFWFDEETNLHSVWDNALVNFQKYSYTEYACNIDLATDEEMQNWQEGSLADWFFDSYQLANKVYASVPADGKLGYRYNYMFQETLDTQLLKGGIRLAYLLNQVFE